MKEFVNEDDLLTFEGWLEYQGVDPMASTPDVLAALRSHFDQMRAKPNPKVGLMKLRPPPASEHRYANSLGAKAARCSRSANHSFGKQ
jgi:hypothetical protein